MGTRLKISSLALVLTLSAPIATANTLNAIPPNVAADLLYQLETLQQEVSQLRGQVEQQQYELNKLKSLSKDRYIDLDKRVSTLAAQTQASPPVVTSANLNAQVADSTVTLAPSTAVAPIAAAPVRPVKLVEPSPEARASYNSAYELIRNKKFDEAQAAYRRYVSKFPNNTLTGNAHYWLGELALVLGNQGEALVQFKTVQESFAGHAKVPDAIYKLGIVNDQLGNQSLAKEFFQRVISQFPESNSAALATNYLNNMQ